MTSGFITLRREVMKHKFIIGGIEYKYNKKINGMMTEMIINDNDFMSKLLEIPEGKKESIISIRRNKVTILVNKILALTNITNNITYNLALDL